jgi:hypothetical protein
VKRRCAYVSALSPSHFRRESQSASCAEASFAGRGVVTRCCSIVLQQNLVIIHRKRHLQGHWQIGSARLSARGAPQTGGHRGNDSSTGGPQTSPTSSPGWRISRALPPPNQPPGTPPPNNMLTSQQSTSYSASKHPATVPEQWHGAQSRSIRFMAALTIYKSSSKRFVSIRTVHEWGGTMRDDVAGAGSE